MTRALLISAALLATIPVSTFLADTAWRAEHPKHPVTVAARPAPAPVTHKRAPLEMHANGRYTPEAAARWTAKIWGIELTD